MALSRVSSESGNSSDIQVSSKDKKVPPISDCTQEVFDGLSTSQSEPSTSLRGRVSKTNADFIKSLESILPPGRAESFLTKEAFEGQIPPSRMTIRDLLPEKIEEYKDWLEEMLYEGMSVRMIKDLDTLYQQGYGPQFSVETLNESKKRELLQKMDEYCGETFKMKVDAFEKGASIKEVFSLCLRDPLNFWADPPYDFDVKGNFRALQEASSRFMSLSKEEERYSDLVVRLRQKQAHHAHFKKVDEMFSNLDRASSNLCRVRWYFETAKKLNKPVQDLNEPDLDAFQESLRNIISENQKFQAEESDRMAQELMESEVPKTSVKSKAKLNKGKAEKRSSKKPVSQKSNSSSVEKVHVSIETKMTKRTEERDKLKKLISNLNSKNSNSLRLHARIKRWEVKDINKIRVFEDFEMSSGASIMRYQHSSPPELIKFRAFHRLAGIERILSDSKLREKYSYPYHYTHFEKIHHGRGLYCEVKIGKETFIGIIYVGIGSDNVIYHAMFESLEGNHLLPSQMTKGLGEYFNDSQDDEPWTLASQRTFDLLPNDKISFKIGIDPKDRVEYQIFPLR